MKHHAVKGCGVLGDRTPHIRDLSTSFMSQVLFCHGKSRWYLLV